MGVPLFQHIISVSVPKDTEVPQPLHTAPPWYALHSSLYFNSFLLTGARPGGPSCCCSDGMLMLLFPINYPLRLSIAGLICVSSISVWGMLGICEKSQGSLGSLSLFNVASGDWGDGAHFICKTACFPLWNLKTCVVLRRDLST